MVMWTWSGIIAGTLACAGGLLGVSRCGKKAGQAVNVMVGGLLTLVGGTLDYIFLQWYLNLSGDPEAMQRMTELSLLFIFVIAGVGVVIALVGFWQVWTATRSS